MKIEKNKIVFASVLVIVIIFIVVYSIMVMGDEEDVNKNLEQTQVPELLEDQKEYDSKLAALNDLREVREINAPSIYDEKLIDSLGFYDRDLPEKEKSRIVDSIYASNRIAYSKKSYKNMGVKKVKQTIIQKIDSSEIKANLKIKAKEMGLEHQLFFASDPKKNLNAALGLSDSSIKVAVSGNQIVKTNSRIKLRLLETATINGRVIEENTFIFGFIKFQSNRALIEIENIGHHPTNLKAFDLQDGSEGIYIENSFREEATSEVLDDIIQDINIPSIPQLGGITKVLRRNNRNVKVTVLNNYKLILKPTL